MFQTALLIFWVAVATGFSFGPDLRVLKGNISSTRTISKMTNLRGVYSSFFDKNRSSLRRSTELLMSNSESVEPQAISTGYSSHPDLLDAIQEATKVALEGLPSLSRNQIDLGMIHVSSIYDGQYSPTVVVPAILDACTTFYKGIVEDQVLKKLVGCYAGGVIGKSNKQSTKNFTPIENEGGAGVVITMFLLPETAIRTFHVMEDDVPDDVGRLSPDSWKTAVHLSGVDSSPPGESEATFMLLPSPSFQKDADDFLRGMNMAFGDKATVFGALASTVSSLSRARLFRYDVDEPNCSSILAEGCLGVVFNGDFQAKVMVAQGAKPVGGIYRIISGQGSTVGAIQLDEVATEQLQSFDTDDGDEEEDEESLDEMDVKKRAAAAYAKASIPKPLLAEANYLMKTLSDDDQGFMRKSILLGLEISGGIPKSPNELIRLAEGQGHRFAVHQVASAGMKDGSVTLPLGVVNIEKGQRLRFFVRDGNFGKKEVDAVLTGYKKKEIEASFSDQGQSFNPSACIFFPTLDRGQKFFGGKGGYESNKLSEFLPTVSSISGFFCNGVIAALDENDSKVRIHGSASCYAIVGSKSNRPVYSSAMAKAEREVAEQKAREEEIALRLAAAEEKKRTNIANGFVDSNENPAPRSEDGELILKRREIHSGRALTVSAVEWSVAEKTAVPSSTLEGFMWEKETEVDRLRERQPLANMVSQCKLFDLDPTKPKPRGWAAAVRAALKDDFIVIPEVKRIEPTLGSLRKRYDIQKITKRFVMSGARALSVNCDQVLFGGSHGDILEVREASINALIEAANAEDGKVTPPILASDLILYPYQLYKLRLAGADAVNLIVGSLASKDLLYLTKIAATLKMDVVASVTSEVQLRSLMKCAKDISAVSVSNRDLETFSFDNTGSQALSLLKSDAIKALRELNPDLIILAEGRVGLIMDEQNDHTSYINELQNAGAHGAIIGGALASMKDDLNNLLK